MAYCKHMEEVGGIFSSNFYCNISGKRENIPNSYWSYCKNGGYGCPWYSNEYGTGGGCFVTTVTCGVLGKDDHDPVMDALRKFRDEVLQKSEEFDSVLKLYDKVGPTLACRLFHDKDRDEKAAKLYEKLGEFAEAANKGEHTLAAKRYIMMTLRLVADYGMQKDYRALRDNNFGYQEGEFDRKVAGHGKKMAKTIENE